MTHDYTRHGTTTLFAAFDVLDGKVVGRCMQRHCHHEFIRFLNAVEKTVPATKAMHESPEIRGGGRVVERFAAVRTAGTAVVGHASPRTRHSQQPSGS